MGYGVPERATCGARIGQRERGEASAEVVGAVRASVLLVEAAVLRAPASPAMHVRDRRRAQGRRSPSARPPRARRD